MKKKKPRAVVDTNLLISGLISANNPPSLILKAWRKKRFILVVSPVLLQEFEEVLGRPKLAKYNLSQPTTKKLVISISKQVKNILPLQKLPLAVRDPKDERVLACALGSKADYLVTGDKDLLVLKDDPKIKPLKIVTVGEFLSQLFPNS